MCFSFNFNTIYSFKFLFLIILELKKINITFLKVDHLHSQLGHAKVVMSMPFEICYATGQVSKFGTNVVSITT